MNDKPVKLKVTHTLCHPGGGFPSHVLKSELRIHSSVVVESGQATDKEHIKQLEWKNEKYIEAALYEELKLLLTKTVYEYGARYAHVPMELHRLLSDVLKLIDQKFGEEE